jgi:hypothetical protein
VESKKRLYDLFPELKKEFDPLHPNMHQQDQKVIRSLIRNPDAPVTNPIDFTVADTEIQRDGLEHPKHTGKLNMLRRKLGINQV